MLEEIAASGAAMNGCSAIHLSIFGMEPVRRYGSPELAAEVLPRVATGELHVAFGVTEPDAGTDTTAITHAGRARRRRVRRDGGQGLDDEGAVLRACACCSCARRRARSARVRPTG